MQETRSHTYHPRITFQDTNVVGNVYFLTFFRWQAECRDEWLRAFRPALWQSARTGELFTTRWSTRFEDPFGATIGDDVSVTITVSESDEDCITAMTQVFKRDGVGQTRIASGEMVFTTSPKHVYYIDKYPTGPCYTYATSTACVLQLNSIDLLGLQGKCRELFLADFAIDTLRQVANRELILQTTVASMELLQLPPLRTDRYRIEMRLEPDPRQLKWGQMQVRFDYFAVQANGAEKRFAVGRQRMSSKHYNGRSIAPLPFYAELLLALRKFSDSPQILSKIDSFLTIATAQAEAQFKSEISKESIFRCLKRSTDPGDGVPERSRNDEK